MKPCATTECVASEEVERVSDATGLASSSTAVHRCFTLSSRSESTGRRKTDHRVSDRYQASEPAGLVSRLHPDRVRVGARRRGKPLADRKHERTAASAPTLDDV